MKRFHISSSVIHTELDTLHLLVSFLCLMDYEPLWVIQCQRYPYRIVVVLFNP